MAAENTSVLRGHDVVCISSIDWDFIWQGHQQIMSALAAHGNRVLFIENTGVRPPRFADFQRVRHRLARWWNSTKGFREEAPNLFVYSPLIVPLPYSRLARAINRRLLLRAVRRWMRIMRFGRPLVWTFLPTPLARDLMGALAPTLTVYYCIDDLGSSSLAARKIRRSEEQVFTEADLVFVTSERLRERAARFTERVHLFPFAVDYPRFEAGRESLAPLPDDLARLPRPIVGYLGGLHQWVDQDLLAETARALPDATFVLIGPEQSDTSRLAACPNVRMLGARSHADVPRYLKGFDVAVIPYRLSDYTAHVYPTKLNEYLAMGLPVVTTDLPEIRRFNRDHGDVVAVASDAASFASAVRIALEKAAPEVVELRLAVARQNSWDARIARMSELVEARLQARRDVEMRWEERLRQIYRRAQARAVRAAAVVAIGCIALFWSPLPWIVAEPLRVSAAPQAADAIVVFAGGVGESGKPEGYQERVEQAVRLHRARWATHIVFSTGFAYVFAEAEVMKTLAISLGVPADAILLEEKAGGTYHNVTFVRPILARHAWRKVLLVSSPYHMRRALLTFHKIAPEIEVVPTPGESRFYEHRTGATPAQLKAILHEYVSIAYYWWKGWI